MTPGPAPQRWLRRAARLLLGLAFSSAAQAASLRYCDPPPSLTAAQQDRLLRFAAIVRDELEGSLQRVALVSRSGLDLSRFAQRYSHAGVSLKASANTPWSVRQLYFSCEEQVPRLYDQGLAGFVQGTSDPELGFVSVLLLPAADAETLEQAALDNARALQLLGAAYSANAYAFALRYQNCNQWLAELLAEAWGERSNGSTAPRERAQSWLKDQGYRPTVFEVGWMLGLTAFVPWLHQDDHPAEDLAQARLQVSMPAAIEAFVRATRPAARRLEFCHDGRRVVIHQGWEPIADGCVAGAQDRVVPLR